MTTPDRSSTLLEIAGRIAAERHRLGMTQEEFGAVTQTHRNTVRRYETGERQPHTLFLGALEKLGIDVTYILTGVHRDSHQKLFQALGGEFSPEKIADAVLAVGDKRSAAYRRGLVDVLAFRLEGLRIHCPYQAGTAEFDAYFAGNERGHFQWRLMVDGAWKPN